MATSVTKSEEATLREGLALGRAFLKAHNMMADLTDRGQDDLGMRDTPSYRDWLAGDCVYTEALTAFSAWCDKNP